MLITPTSTNRNIGIYATVEQCKRFADVCMRAKTASPCLSALADVLLWQECVTQARVIWSREIESACRLLGDAATAITTLDIAEDIGTTKEADAFWGAVIAASIAENVFSLALDVVNKMPVTVFTASAANQQRLAAAGLAAHSSISNLDFHTDGVVKNGVVLLPHHVMVYNMMLNYDQPGQLHWIPFACWGHFRKFAERLGISKKYRIQLSPMIYDDGAGALVSRGLKEVIVPVVTLDVDGSLLLFWNGQIIGTSDGSAFDEAVVSEFQRAMTDAPRISVDQRPRRAVLLDNRRGAHARDLFSWPRTTNGYSRISLRAISTATTRL